MMEWPDSLKEEIDNLIQQGALEVVGIDEDTGEFLYSFTEKLIDINPEMHRLMLQSFHDSMMRLWEKGFLYMDVTKQNPLVTATEKVFDQNAINSLSKEDQMALSDILNKMSQ
jgi:hypothetical protein